MGNKLLEIIGELYKRQKLSGFDQNHTREIFQRFLDEIMDYIDGGRGGRMR